jgi:hypothetical protein
MADFGLKQTIEKTDIMMLLTLTWADSFNIVENNKNACSDWGWIPLNSALMEHGDLKEGQRSEVEYATSHAAMFAFNNRRDLVDPVTQNMEELFSETSVNGMVDASLKKIKEAGAEIILLAEKRHTTARFRISDSKTFHAGSWDLGYGHHLGPEAVEISNKKNKNRKEDELEKRNRAHEKSKKIDDEVKRVCTKSPPEEWKTPEYVSR